MQVLLIALVGALGLINGLLFLIDSIFELALGPRRQKRLWRELLARRDVNWLDRLPSQLAKLNVPRPATAAWLLEGLLGACLVLIGVLSFSYLS